MKYNIKDIGDAGLRAAHHLGHDEVVGLLAPLRVELAEGPASLHLELELTRTDYASPSVFARGTLEAEFAVCCARCLGPALVRLEQQELRLTYLPPKGTEAAADEDLDTYVHDGQTIDLEPMVREQLVLAIPITPLCRADCRGICTGCGAELNTEPCGCPKESTGASPLRAALGALGAGSKKDASGS